MTQFTIQLLLTGDELMSGDIIDSNSALVAHQLNDIGIELSRKVTLGDNLDLLIAEITHITKQSQVLIINGGLGPTIDDLTALAVAKAANVKLVEHPKALEHLTAWCQKRNTELNQANLKQALLPEGCDIIENPIGSAVGISLTINNCQVFCTPGVPSELEAMLADSLRTNVLKLMPDKRHYQVTRLHLFGIGESKIQQLINNEIQPWPDNIELGFRAASPYLELKLTTKTEQAKAVLPTLLAHIEIILGEHIIEYVTDKPMPMAQHVINLLSKQNKTLTTAESCTGGLIASLMTQISGASNCFEAGFVTYSNDIKSRIIDVSPQTLDQFGAVSEAVVIEMAQGALKKSGADYAIAVSGIAGPCGGTLEKPVGSVWLAWGTQHEIRTKYFCIKGNRQYFQTMVAVRSLDLIRRMLLNSNEKPFYC